MVEIRHAIFFVLDHSTNKSVLLWLVIAKIANQIILSVGGGCEGGPIFYSISWGFVTIQKFGQKKFKSPDTYRQTLLDVSLSIFLRFLPW